VFGVCAPVPHGVVNSSLEPSPPVGEYIPNSVDDVRFSIDRVLLGGDETPGRRSISRSAFMFSGVGEGGEDEFSDAGGRSKALRGIGRRTCGISMIKDRAGGGVPGCSLIHGGSVATVAAGSSYCGQQPRLKNCSIREYVKKVDDKRACSNSKVE